MKNQLKPIENFVLNEHTNNLYKLEAKSSLNLAKEVAAKLNEVISAFNQLAKEKWEKIHEQDGKIRAGILYMKDNLLNTINSLLNSKGEEMMDNAVKEYLGSLKADLNILGNRLNNLLGNVTTGSTTLDAEVIDIRSGADGKNYTNAGESIRTQLSNKNYGFCLTNNEPELEFKVSEYAKITFKGITHIFYNNRRYDIPECVVEKDLTSYANLFVFLIAYNTKTKTIELIRSTDSLEDGCIIFGRICGEELHLNDVSYGTEDNSVDSTRPLFAPVFSNGNPYLVENEDGTHQIYFPTAHIYFKRKMFNLTERYVDFDYSVVGIVFLILYNITNDTITFLPHANRIPEGNVVIGTYSKWYGVSLFTFNNEFKHKQSESSLILGASNSFVEFDSVNKVVTFPNDTLILIQGLPHYYSLSAEKGNNSISYAHMTSSALSIFYNIYTDQLEVLQYNSPKQPHQLLLCSFRTTCGAVSIPVPYKWNGKPFNIDLTSEIELTSENVNIKSINHRGYYTAPENTLSAYKLSAKHGFKYVECDVSFTSDNVAVLLHDDTIDRTSNGSGSIANLTYNQVLAYDFGSWKASTYTGEKIPTFEEFISLCKKLGLHPYIELKTGTEAQIKNLVSIVKKYGMLNNVSWISFSISLLGYVYSANNKARLGVCSNTIDSSLITNLLALKNENNEVFIDCLYSAITNENVELCINNDLPLEVWTLNDESILYSLNPYISGVSSDNLHACKLLYNRNI